MAKNTKVNSQSSNRAYIFLLFIFCFIIYGNTLTHDFVYDDDYIIVNNPFIQHWTSDPFSFFNSSYFQKSGEFTYRPVATLTYLVNYSLWKTNPFGFHLFSVLLHTICTILIFFTGLLFFKKNKLLAMGSALLFACHPAISEAVNCVTFNEDILTTIFFLLSFNLYIKSCKSTSNRLFFIFLAFFSFFCALLSKEMAIILPVIIVLYDIFIDSEENFSLLKSLKKLNQKKFFYLGFGLIIFVYLMIRFVWMYFPVESKVVSFGDLYTRFMFLPHNILLYLRLAVFPFLLNADYVFKYPSYVWSIYNLMGLIFISALIYFSFRIYSYSRNISFGIWWYLICLLPVTNIIQISNPWAERYLYLPMFGFCIVIIELLNKMYLSKTDKKNSGYVFFAILIILFSVKTFSRNIIWKDQCTLWQTTVEVSPDSFRAHNNLGRCYSNRMSMDSSIIEFKKAIELNPSDGDLYKNVGSAYYDSKNFADALVYYFKALKLKKDNLELLHIIVQCYNNLDSLDKSLEIYKKLLQIEPANADIYSNMGVIFLKKKNFAESISQLNKSLQLNPNNPNSYFNLGTVYATMGDYKNAISMWEKVLKINPEDQSASKNILKAKKLMEISQ